jgi:hypothetical protein
MDNNSQSENIEEMEGDTLEKLVQNLNVSTEEGTRPHDMYILFKIFLVF